MRGKNIVLSNRGGAQADVQVLLADCRVASRHANDKGGDPNWVSIASTKQELGSKDVPKEIKLPATRGKNIVLSNRGGARESRARDSMQMIVPTTGCGAPVTRSSAIQARGRH